jgi:hypothetical protein
MALYREKVLKCGDGMGLEALADGPWVHDLAWARSIYKLALPGLPAENCSPNLSSEATVKYRPGFHPSVGDNQEPHSSKAT